MKHATNFRLDNESITLLTILHEQLNLSKTEILERALKRYAKNKLKQNSSLLKFSGAMNAEDADELLEITKQRKNKKFNKL